MRQLHVYRLLVIALLALTILGPAQAHSGVLAQGPGVTVTTDVEASFPQGMAFNATLPLPSPDAEVDVVQLLYRIASSPTVHLTIIEPSAFTVGEGHIEISAFIDLLSSFVPPGVDLMFLWEVVLVDGTVVETEPEFTQWRDTRFEWEMRSSDQVRLYTYDASDDFADMMLAASQEAIDDLERHYQLEESPPVSIWVYPSYGDFQGTLQGNMRESIAGLTYQGLDAIAAIVPDGDETEFGRVVLHEISHQVLYTVTSNAFGPPPLWFDEGVALHTQTGGTDFFGRMVEKALEDGTLFDIWSLDASFPYQPQQATLAYASSWSMLLYIETMWGADGVAALIDGFAAGLPAEEAIQSALGLSMIELNDGWKAWISIGAPAG